MLPLEAYLEPDSLNPPASEQSIQQAERDLGYGLPPDYRSFLKLTNGYNGYFGRDEGYAQLIPVEELASWRTGYDVVSRFPAMTLVGSNGGPTAFGFEQTPSGVVYISIPFDVMARVEIRELGKNLTEFIQAIADGEGW
jgi:cell wall assembly regulator SMI1